MVGLLRRHWGNDGLFLINQFRLARYFSPNNIGATDMNLERAGLIEHRGLADAAM